MADDVKEADVVEKVDTYPIQSFRFRAIQDETRICVLQIGTGPGGAGVVHSYLATADMLKNMATVFLKQAEIMSK